VNAWLAAATALTFGLIPCGIVVFTRDAMERVVGLEMAGIILTMIMILIAEGMGNANFYDLPLALSLLAFGGGLVFVRFLERWL
jgi:multisubunit Na+/H+ antiporter MnhF subunit